MSNDKNEKPLAGHNPHLEYERDREDTTPEKGFLYVKDKNGAVLLGQTDKTFGTGKGHSEK